MTSNKLALIVAYYLARFNRDGLKNLGFTSFNQAFEETAIILNVKKNYVKLRRDEFDPVFPWRRGWQRPMDRQVIKTIEAFQDLDDEAMFRIVKDILNNKEFRDGEEVADIIDLISDDIVTKKKGFVVRSITGRKAEEFFMAHHSDHGQPISGNLVDTRDLGCGYDFRIEGGQKICFVEVKGMSDLTGGIVFTDKEWNTARKEGDKYYLAIVRNVIDSPDIQLIQNPAKSLSADRRIYTTIQVQWSVSETNLKEF